MIQVNGSLSSRLGKVMLSFVWLALAASALPMAAYAQEDQEKAQPQPWEYRPYQVQVWVVHDDAYRIRETQHLWLDKLARQTHLIDRSGWNVEIKRAENPWNWRLLAKHDRNELTEEIKQTLTRDKANEDLDKLIIVTLRERSGRVHITTSELDMKTDFWGSEIESEGPMEDLSSLMLNGITQAFAPLVLIGKVRVKDRDVKPLQDVTRVRVRASMISQHAIQDDRGQWVLAPNMGSPVWIDDNQAMATMILRKDRRGNLTSIQAVEWTFLTIYDRDGAHLDCEIHSKARAPLSGRRSSRTEKVGLCVQAPPRSTTLTLISRGENPVPLADLEVYSRLPGMKKGESNELVGITNFQGVIEIPQNEIGFRILLVKSGNRPLARLPLVVGQASAYTIAMPNDEERLYAEGVVRGLQNKLFDYVAERQIHQAQMKGYLEDGELEKAEKSLNAFRRIPNATKFGVVLNADRARLRSDAEKQGRLIEALFDELQKNANEFLPNVLEHDLRRELQNALSKQGRR